MHAPLRIGIAGAGVLGRLLAWVLTAQGHRVTVWDPAPGPHAQPTGHLTPPGLSPAAGFTAAGMLSPVAELDHADPDLARLGWRSLALWQAVTQALQAQGPSSALMQRRGSLLLAHGSDLGAAQRVLSRLHSATAQAPELPRPQPLDRHALAALEPAVLPDLHAWLLPGEGQLMPHELLPALAQQAPGVNWRWGQTVTRVDAGQIHPATGPAWQGDLAIDTRGLGARAHDGPGRSNTLSTLRGVRGEVVWLHAPGVGLQRPLRLLHPRHRVYLVPRPGDLLVLGASEVESEDRSPVSLKSAVELMAAAHSVLPALAEARIVHLDVNLRPAFADHRPRIEHEPGLLRINGLFRHGWLLAPALAEEALRDV